jgi:hypothetical protein
VAQLLSEDTCGTPTLWVNFYTYGSAAAGFYLDPLSGQVWTSERGWHEFSPAIAAPAAVMPVLSVSRAAFLEPGIIFDINFVWGEGTSNRSARRIQDRAEHATGLLRVGSMLGWRRKNP